VQAFIVAIITKVLSDPKVQAALKNILSELITEKISPLIPLAAASAAHAFVGLIPGAAPALEDVVSVANTVRQDLNKAIPDIDIGIPLIDDIIDAWRPRNG